MKTITTRYPYQKGKGRALLPEITRIVKYYNTDGILHKYIVHFLDGTTHEELMIKYNIGLPINIGGNY